MKKEIENMCPFPQFSPECRDRHKKEAELKYGKKNAGQVLADTYNKLQEFLGSELRIKYEN